MSSSYATIDDLRSAGLPQAALAGVALEDKQAALVRASREADTYLRDRYTLPLCAPFDPALVDWVCQVAAYRLMQLRGFNPAGNIDQSIALGYQHALDSLTRVANGRQQLAVTQASPASEQPTLSTNISRGYGGPGGTDYPVVGSDNVGL